MAVLSLGAISTSVYPSLTTSEIEHILKDSGAKLIFVENEEQQNKILEVSTYSGAMISFEKCREDCPRLEELIQRSDSLEDRTDSVLQKEISKHLESSRQTAERSSIASLVYTSGTTGLAKGVVQTHENHISMADSLILSGLLDNGEAIFLFLPLAHSFARLVAYGTIACGGNFILLTVVDRKGFAL